MTTSSASQRVRVPPARRQVRSVGAGEATQGLRTGIQPWRSRSRYPQPDWGRERKSKDLKVTRANGKVSSAQLSTGGRGAAAPLSLGLRPSVRRPLPYGDTGPDLAGSGGTLGPCPWELAVRAVRHWSCAVASGPGQVDPSCPDVKAECSCGPSAVALDAPHGVTPTAPRATPHLASCWLWHDLPASPVACGCPSPRDLYNPRQHLSRS